MKWLYAYVQGFSLPYLINLETLPQLFRLVRLLKKIPLNLPAIAMCAGIVADQPAWRWQAGSPLIKGYFFGQSRFPPLKKGG